jgi:hypothetical protein
MPFVRRSLRVLAVAASLASLVGVVAPLGGSAAGAPASAAGMRDFRIAGVPANLPADVGSGSGFCGSVSGTYSGRTVYGYNLGPSYLNVFACGPTLDQGWNNDPFESDFQCVEYSTRFMWEAYGLRAAPGNGGVFVANNHARFPSIVVGTPSPGNIPAPGDVVSLSGGAANPNAASAGHTAVVSDVSHVNMATGNGYITIVEENDGGAGTGRINVSNWSESMGNPQYANGLYWYPTVSWLELAGSASTAPGAASETRVCATCAPPLLHHGGPVMGTATLASIYWSTGPAVTPGYRSIIDGYLTNVSLSDPNSNVFGSNPLYGGSPPTTPPFTFAGGLSDASPLPAGGCAPDPGYTTCLSRPQVENEVNHVIYSQGSAPALDLAHVYVLFLPPGVESCAGPGSCSASSFCGYHSSYTYAGGTVLYAVVAYPTASTCTTGQSPNGDPIADGAVDTVSHQISETITDPLGTAWTDTAGNEIGDECANVYGAPVGSTDATKPKTSEFNQLIGSGAYYTQEEFSNSAYFATGNGCIQSPSQQAPGAGNGVSATGSPAQVPNDGSSTSTVTATVRSVQQQPVSGDRVHFTTFTRSGTCGTVNPTDVTTDASGHAATTYTASTADATCSVVATEATTGSNGRAVITQGVAGVYHALTPVRVADTRSGSGLPLAGQSLSSGQSDKLPVAGSNGVPADATTAVLNVTVTNPTSPSYLTVYPGGTAAPLASNLNFAAGQTVANLVTVPIGGDGTVRFFNHAGTTDVVVDLEGYMQRGAGPAGLYHPAVPSRITDTRPGSGQANAGASLGKSATLMVQVAGAGGVPASGVSAVVLNLTAVGASAPSFLTAFPSDAVMPLASNLNFLPGQVVPNRVIVPLGADGRVAVYNHLGGVDVVVDVAGWFTSGSDPQATGFRFTPIAPTRVVDTRALSGQPLAGATLSTGGFDSTSVASTASLPANAAGFAANVTVAGTTGASYLTVYPAGAAMPTSSDLNWVAGQIASNMLVSGLGTGGSITLYNHWGQSDVIVDLCGFWS